MPVRWVVLALWISLVPPALTAAVSYTVVKSGDVLSRQRRFSVVADEGRIRATAAGDELDAATVYDGLIATEGTAVVALNSQNSTWFELDDAAPFAPSSHYLQPLFKPSVRNVVAQFKDAGTSAAGERHYTGELSYEVAAVMAGETVKVSCTVSYEVTTVDKPGRREWPGRVLPATGLSAVDTKLAAADAAIDGFPRRISLTVTRKYAGGPAMRDSALVETSEIREAQAAASLFGRPAGYRHEKPVVGAPGQ